MADQEHITEGNEKTKKAGKQGKENQ